MRHTISVLVENEFGVLSRVSGLFSGRGFNIESLTVAETMDPTVSRMIWYVGKRHDAVCIGINVDVGACPIGHREGDAEKRKND